MFIMALERRLSIDKINRFAEERLQIALEAVKIMAECADRGHGEISWKGYLVENPRRRGKKRPGTCLECGGRVYGHPSSGQPPGWAEKRYFLYRRPITR
jgi:hypothetical protein